MQPQRTPAKQDKQVQIADDLRIQIEAGELAPGHLLPSVGELTKEYDCSPAAARAAIELLKQQGFVTGGRGKPATVRVPLERVVRSSDRHQAEKDLVLRPANERAATGVAETDVGVPIDRLRFTARYSPVEAPQDIADKFGVDVGAPLLRREFELVNPRSQRRVAWSVSYLPYDLVSARPELLDETKARELGSTQYQLYMLGVELARVDDVVTSRMPTTVDMEVWGLEKGTPLLIVRRISFDTQGRVVEVSDAEFPADRTELRFTTQLEPWPASVWHRED